MSAAWKKTAKDLFQKATDTAIEASEKIKEEYEKSDIKVKVDSHSAQFNQVLEQSGVKSKVEQLANATGDSLDTISGVKILKLVEERLALQAKYNDILATKLDEALNRIRQLEEQTSKPKN
jgi:hypothetical protein